MSNRRSPYNVIDVMISKNVDEDTAKKLIEEHKLKTSQSLNGFLYRYGDELGKIKYQEFKDKSKPSIENYKKRYGESWEEKWLDYMSTRNTRSLKHFINKYGEEIGTIKFNETNEKWKYKLSLPHFIEKYGKDIGEEKYNAFLKSKDSSSLEMCKKKHGDTNGVLVYKKRCMDKDSSSLNFFIKKYGDIIGNDMYNIKCRNVSPIFNEMIKIYDKDTALEEYNNYILNKPSNIVKNVIDILQYKHRNNGKNFCKSPVSKSSIKLFSLLEKTLGRNIRYGARKNELTLYDDINHKKYYYDCYDEKSNTIIEYNGSPFHPNENIPLIEQKDWYTLFGVSFEDALLNDKQKIKYAESLGYVVLVVWDYEIKTLSKLHNKIKELVEKIEYESNKSSQKR